MALVELALLIAVVVYALQARIRRTSRRRVKNVAFFYVPFALLFLLLLDVPLDAAAAGQAASASPSALALAVRGVGFVEYATGHLLPEPEGDRSRTSSSPYFRVNSLFFDPNIYGRFLALVMIVLAAIAAVGARPRAAGRLGRRGARACCGPGWCSTFSQSSFAALLSGWPCSPRCAGGASR